MGLLLLAVAILVFFGAVGIAHVVNPDRFLKHSGLRKGGEMLTEWNRLGIQIAGAVFAGFAISVLESLLEDYISN
jgi:hypothetical protein